MELIKFQYLLIAIFIVIQVFVLARWPLVDWDESVYIGMGKWLYSGGQAGLWEPFRPLVLPLILGSLWAAGLNVILAGHIIALLFSIGCIFLVFLIGKKFLNEKLGLLAALVLAITPIFFSFSTSLLTDIPSTFFALLAVWLFMKKRLGFSGLAAGLAFLTRFPQGLVAVVILILLIFDFAKNRKIGPVLKFLTGLCVVIPYLIFNQILYGDVLAPLLYAMEVIHGESLWLYNLGLGFYFWTLPVQNAFFVFSLAGLYFYFKKKIYLNRNVNVIVACLLLFFGYFTLLAHKDVRFAIPFIPYLALLGSYGFVNLFKKIKPVSMIIILIALLIPSVVHVGNYFSKMQIEGPDILTQCQLGPGQILSSTPLIVKTVDNPIIGYYSLAFETYQKFRNSSTYIIFTPDSFPCPDQICEQKRSQLFEIIKTENQLLCEGRGAYGQATYIFRTSV